MTPLRTYKDLNRNFGLQGEADLLYDKDAIRQALYNLLTTVPGEAGPIFNPEFGSLLPLLIHEPMDDVTAYKLESATIQAVQRWEPRIQLDLSQTKIVPDYNLQAYHVTLVYRIRRTGDLATSNLLLNLNPDGDTGSFTTLEKIIAIHALGWPGVKEYCVVNAQNWLVLNQGATWGDLTTWDAWTEWGASTDYFRFTTVVDHVYSAPRVVKTAITGPTANQVISVQIAFSGDGTTYTAFQPITEEPVTSRFMKFQLIVTSPQAALSECNLIFYI